MIVEAHPDRHISSKMVSYSAETQPGTVAAIGTATCTEIYVSVGTVEFSRKWETCLFVFGRESLF